MMESSTPVTVTVWAVLQLEGVKIRLEVDDGPFGRVAGADRNGNVGSGRVVESDREAGRAAGFGRHQPRGRSDDDLRTRGRRGVAGRDRPVHQGARDQPLVILDFQLPGARDALSLQGSEVPLRAITAGERGRSQR